MAEPTFLAGQTLPGASAPGSAIQKPDQQGWQAQQPAQAKPYTYAAPSGVKTVQQNLTVPTSEYKAPTQAAPQTKGLSGNWYNAGQPIQPFPFGHLAPPFDGSDQVPAAAEQPPSNYTAGNKVVYDPSAAQPKEVSGPQFAEKSVDQGDAGSAKSALGNDASSGKPFATVNLNGRGVPVTSKSVGPFVNYGLPAPVPLYVSPDKSTEGTYSTEVGNFVDAPWFDAAANRPELSGNVMSALRSGSPMDPAFVSRFLRANDRYTAGVRGATGATGVQPIQVSPDYVPPAPWRPSQDTVQKTDLDNSELTAPARSAPPVYADGSADSYARSAWNTLNRNTEGVPGSFTNTVGDGLRNLADNTVVGRRLTTPLSKQLGYDRDYKWLPLGDGLDWATGGGASKVVSNEVKDLLNLGTSPADLIIAGAVAKPVVGAARASRTVAPATAVPKPKSVVPDAVPQRPVIDPAPVPAPMPGASSFPVPAVPTVGQRVRSALANTGLAAAEVGTGAGLVTGPARIVMAPFVGQGGTQMALRGVGRTGMTAGVPALTTQARDEMVGDSGPGADTVRQTALNARLPVRGIYGTNILSATDASDVLSQLKSRVTGIPQMYAGTVSNMIDGGNAPSVPQFMRMTLDNNKTVAGGVANNLGYFAKNLTDRYRQDNDRLVALGGDPSAESAKYQAAVDQYNDLVRKFHTSGGYSNDPDSASRIASFEAGADAIRQQVRGLNLNVNVDGYKQLIPRLRAAEELRKEIASEPDPDLRKALVDELDNTAWKGTSLEYGKLVAPPRPADGTRLVPQFWTNRDAMDAYAAYGLEAPRNEVGDLSQRTVRSLPPENQTFQRQVDTSRLAMQEALNNVRTGYKSKAQVDAEVARLAGIAVPTVPVPGAAPVAPPVVQPGAAPGGALVPSAAAPKPDPNTVNNLQPADPAADGTAGPQQIVPEEVRKNIGGLVSNVGIPVALRVAAGSPPPEGFAGYWSQLPSSSKMLAIGGLSLAAIMTLRSLFASKDDDDESFLTKILPVLGIGIGAWGLGGGTLGFAKENLPSMDNYKRLGNAVTSNLSGVFGSKK